MVDQEESNEILEVNNSYYGQKLRDGIRRLMAFASGWSIEGQDERLEAALKAIHEDAMIQVVSEKEVGGLLDILDVGCGLGRLLWLLSEKQFLVNRYLGVDSVPANIELAKSLAHIGLQEGWLRPVCHEEFVFKVGEVDDPLARYLATYSKSLHCDYAVMSGLFNFLMFTDMCVRKVIDGVLEVVGYGVVVNFLQKEPGMVEDEMLRYWTDEGISKLLSGLNWYPLPKYRGNDIGVFIKK